MKNKIVLLLVLLIFSSINSQEKRDSLKLKSNPIIFGGYEISYDEGSIRGISVGFKINYQKNNNLFTFKYKENYSIEEGERFLLVLINTIKDRTFSEYSLMYGKRYIKKDFSYHFSGGLSYNNILRRDLIENTKTVNTYLGFPLEIGYTWFKSKKEKIKILHESIGVGKPTGFGASIGLNLYANIGKEQYFGLAVVFGLGWHKKY